MRYRARGREVAAERLRTAGLVETRHGLCWGRAGQVVVTFADGGVDVFDAPRFADLFEPVPAEREDDDDDDGTPSDTCNPLPRG